MYIKDAIQVGYYSQITEKYRLIYYRTMNVAPRLHYSLEIYFSLVSTVAARASETFK